MSKRIARPPTHVNKRIARRPLVEQVSDALSRHFLARGLGRFEELEPRHLMTAVGWEIPLLGPTLEQHGALDFQPDVELHGLLDPTATGIPAIEHHSLFDTSSLADSQQEHHEREEVHGFLNLRDYDGNLLSNWQELAAAEDEDHEHEHATEFDVGIVPSANELDSGEIPIDSHYSLWSGKWTQSGGLGSPLTVTYSYSNILDGTFTGITTDQVKAGIEKVLQLWSTYAPLNFVEVVDSGPVVGDTGYAAGSTPNVRIGYHYFDGPSQVLAHAYYPQGTQGLSGDVHFDSGDTWRIGAGGGGIDFVEVALHELGHSLGLQHENVNTAIMNPYYGGRFATLNSAYLLADDIAGIRAMYGTGTGSVAPLVVNQTPVLNAIGDVTMSRSQDTFNVPLTATDSDGDPITFSATAGQANAVDQLAYQLDQQYGFSLNGSDYNNYRGAGEKYVVGSSGQWYFILADGSLHSWNSTIANSPTIATLDSSFHTTLSKLYNAQSVTVTPVNVGLSFNGNNLIIDPASGFTGTFQVNVNASDGNTSASRTFNVTVSNQTPTLAAIADKSMRPSDDSIAVTLNFADSDGDALTVTASVPQPDAVKAAAYALDQQNQFQAAAGEYHNSRGAGEKYFQNASGSWYFILANGQVYNWTGSIAGSTLLATLDSRFHADLSLLTNAQPDTSAPANVVLSVNGNTLTVNPPNGYTGAFAVTVTVSDGAASAQRTFQLDVANHAPILNAIADQSMSPGTLSKTVVISASDTDGDSVLLSATVVQTDAVAQQAYDLDQQRGFQSAGTDHYNLRGAGERYFIDGSNNWYFILPNGGVYSWGGSIGGSTLLATLNSTYHTTVSSLYNAQAPNAQVINVGLSWNGNSLTITPPNGFTGSFQVTVTASDGALTASRSFAMTVVNRAPQIANIANQTMSPSADTLQVALNVSDADGDSLTYVTSAVQPDAITQTAYDLDQQYNFQAASSEYLNYRGANEKYFQDAGGNFYFILPDARVYVWANSIAGSTLLGQLDASYYANLTKFYNVATPTGTAANVVLQVSNGQLTIDPAANFSGSFRVTVSVSDGQVTSQTSFQVTVANQLPTLAAIANQTMTSSQDSIQVAFTAADADGDTLTVTATASQADATAQLAYNLDQQYGFYAASSEYPNLRGAGEKYFQGTGGGWFFILANGQVYQWGGSIAGSTLLGTLNSSYHANVSLVHQAQQPTVNPVNVVLGAANGVLTINPASNFTGQFDVTLSVSDGVASAARTFSVTVTASGGLSTPGSSAGMVAADPGVSQPLIVAIPSSRMSDDAGQPAMNFWAAPTGQESGFEEKRLPPVLNTTAPGAPSPNATIERAFSFFNRHNGDDGEDGPTSEDPNEFLDDMPEEAAVDVVFSDWDDSVE